MSFLTWPLDLGSATGGFVSFVDPVAGTLIVRSTVFALTVAPIGLEGVGDVELEGGGDLLAEGSASEMSDVGLEGTGAVDLEGGGPLELEGGGLFQQFVEIDPEAGTLIVA
jgi:hypothetical protein